LGEEAALIILNSSRQAPSSLKLAITGVFESKEGKMQRTTRRHKLILRGKLAAYAAQHFTKGEKHYVEEECHYKVHHLGTRRKKEAGIPADKIFFSGKIEIWKRPHCI
jgi:hypothetical protein